MVMDKQQEEPKELVDSLVIWLIQLYCNFYEIIDVRNINQYYYKDRLDSDVKIKGALIKINPYKFYFKHVTNFG